MAEFTIGPYTPRHRTGVVRLWGEVFAADPVRNAPEVMLDRKLATDGLLWVASPAAADPGSAWVCGAVMAGYDGVRGWIYHLAVAPKYRRRGLGQRLVRAAEAGLVALGCPKVNLQVRGGSAAAGEFYSALGYHVEDRVSFGRVLE